MSYTRQTTLTEEEAPMILDATCSTKKIWPANATVRIDKSRNVRPDVQADARNLPFRPGIFDKIYCDPPHLIARKGWELEQPEVGAYFASVNRHRRGMYHQHILNNYRRFGLWHSREDWLDFIEKTDGEFALALRTDGTLFYKLGETRDPKHSVKIGDMAAYSRFTETARRVTESRVHNPTYWLTMKPSPKPEAQR